jgi:hypothetical protein
MQPLGHAETHAVQAVQSVVDARCIVDDFISVIILRDKITTFF